MSILKFVFEEKSTSEKPVGTKITHPTGKTYIKESTGWFNTETGKKLDYKSSLILENNINFVSDSRGTFIDGHKLTPEQAYPFKGLHMVNGKWVNDDRQGVIDDRRQDELNNIYRNTQKEIQNQNKDAEPINGKGLESNKDGYFYDGKKLSPEQAKPFNGLRYSKGKWSNIDSSKGSIDAQTQHFLNKKLNAIKSEIGNKDTESKPESTPEPRTSSIPKAQQANTSSNVPNNSAKAQEVPSAPVQSTPKAEPVNNSSSESSPKEEPEAQNEPEQKSSDTVPSSIPNGYVYTSGKGNKFMYKNGTWFNLANKKPVNQSNVNMLNRSAEKSINDFNAKSDIKIGDKVKSGKGVEYTYNGTGFSSADGKQLTGGAAQSALNKLKAEKAGSAKDSGATDSNATGTNEPKQDDTIVPGQSAVDTNAPEQQSTQGSSEGQEQGQNDPNDYTAQSIINNLGDNDTGSTDNSNGTSQDSGTTQSTEPSTQPKDPMTELAQKIKSSKYNKQIVTLLSRGGDMDLLAADILLNGNVQEVINQLKSLNNSNTQ